ncbi:MAG: type 2 lanthipeptide synthetase LanM family protein [Acidobacteriota bacterium]
MARTATPHAELSEVFARGETLHERLARSASASSSADPSQPPSTPPDSPPHSLAAQVAALSPAQRRALEPWARAVAGGDLTQLAKRLSWDGSSLEAAARAFGVGDQGAPAPVAWHRDFQCFVELSQSFAARAAAVRSIACDAASSVPFATLWRPWLALAEQRLVAARADWDRRLSASARIHLVDALHEELGELAALAAYLLFEEDRQLEEGRAPDPSGAYRRFVEAVLHEPLRLYGRFPVLARQAAEHVARWTDALLEMLERLEVDERALLELWPELVGGGESPALRIESVDGGLSDGHHGGRSVRRLRFTGGGRLVYKPRDVGADAVFERLVATLRSLGCDLPPAPRVLERAGYGWVETIVAAPLDDRAAAVRYVRRAGALVALAYALRARDLHAENVVATAEGPVVVDGEMFFQPEAVMWSTAAGSTASGSTGTTTAEGGASCLHSGLLLLPAEGDTDGGDETQGPRDLGGLRPARLRPGVGVGAAWSGLGGDAIAVEARAVRGRRGDNTPRLDGDLLDPAAFGDELKAGFTDAYECLQAQRDAFIDEALDEVATARVRVLLRPSQAYGRALTLARRARNQRSGLATGLIAETLLAPLVARGRRPQVWPLAATERAALLAGDIPHLSVAGDGVGVPTVDGGEVTLFHRSPLDAVRARLRALSADDLARQLEVIDLALRPPVRYGFVAALRTAPPAALEERAWRWAVGLGARVLEASRSIKPEDDPTLGRGALGVALFLAGVARATSERGTAGERELADSASGAARSLLVGLAERPTRWNEVSSIGGFDGLGSALYAATWSAQLLDEGPDERLLRPVLAELAERLAPGEQASRVGCDLVGGAAGALLGMLAVTEGADVASGLRDEALALARQAGTRLRTRQDRVGSAGAAWFGDAPCSDLSPRGQGRPLAGMAHGAAGVVRALTALASVDGDADRGLALAATAGLAWERSLFDPAERNWPLLLSEPDSATRMAYRVAWCHGAPGILAARSTLDASWRDDAWTSEVDAALATTRDTPLAAVDHLCCGLAGRAAALLGAAERLRHPAARRAAADLTTRLLARAESRSRFRLRDGFLRDRWQSESFLRGVSGIGWHLLRIAGVRLPDVLVLELPSELRRRQNAGEGDEDDRRLRGDDR